MDSNNSDNVQISAIDRALAAAKARKAAKEALETGDTAFAPAPVAPAPPARDSRREAEAAEKQQRRAEREARRAAKAAERESTAAARGPAHMKKVDRARSKLPPLDDATQLTFNEIIGNFGANQITALALHLQLHNRASLTIRAGQSAPLPLGSTVRITGGEPKFIGLVGQVVDSQKLRAKVQVPGHRKVVYIYSCEAEVVEEAVRATG